MSKSKKNTIDPEEMIKNYGADAVRLFILSDSPPEKDVQWSDQGMIAAYKFIHKFWLIHQNIRDKILSSKKDEVKEKNLSEEKLEEFTNEMIDKITKNLDSFHYNVIIANFHEIYNFLSKLQLSEVNSSTLLENYLKILIVLSPVIPHFSSECTDEIQQKEGTVWPIAIKEFLEKKTLEIVVQLNGKKRGLISCNKNTSEKQLVEIIESDNQYKKYFEDKTIIKTIYVKDRLVNLILK
tara:strand:- start:3498 stop:4211 length:714 start_codon:yes stop_codon:yes gene_type:complete